MGCFMNVTFNSVLHAAAMCTIFIEYTFEYNSLLFKGTKSALEIDLNLNRS
jgi:hypothetical protein